MSFRIEDILKKDFGSSCENIQESCYKSNKIKVQRSFSMNDSILHQTLLRKSYHMGDFSECAFNKYSYLNYYNRERSYSSPVYLNNVRTYSNYYEEKYWPSYTSAAMSLTCHQFNQFKRKGGQIRFTANQTDILEKTFLSHKYLTPEERKMLADSLKLSDRQVKTWFQNRRAKWRRSNSSTTRTDTTSDKQEHIKSTEDVFLE